MVVSRILRSLAFGGVVLGCAAVPLSAQTPAPPQPRKTTASKPPLKDETSQTVPQVVTIVHRLNGLKMFRLLLRSNEELQAVASVDEKFKLTDDVHTNVIAGLTMDDGQTIAARLPEAELEFGPTTFEFGGVRRPIMPDAPPPSAGPATRSQKPTLPGSGLFEAPELTVIAADGRRLAVRYIGLDSLTGLSILKLADKSPTAKPLAEGDTPEVGANVRLFGPEPAAQANSFRRSLYIRIGETAGTIQTVTRAPSGDVARLRVRAPRLKAANVGGVAVNDAGEVLGIVDAIEGTEASILPMALIRRAAKRVLAQQASVPRPFLGVRGEPIAALKAWQIETLGWQSQRAAALAEDRRGMLLTSIVPGSPAALAALQAGDVILKVNDKEIQNAEDFSWWLEQAGPSNSVRFTVLRPKATTEAAVNVKLSGSLESRFSYDFLRRPTPNSKEFSLISLGIETIALRPAVASRLGILAGLLVVYVSPTAVAADGIRTGDVIQSIDGIPVASSKPTMSLSNLPGKKHNFEIVRNKQRFVVTLTNTDSNQ